MKKGLQWTIFVSLFLLIISRICFAQTPMPVAAPKRIIEEEIKPTPPGSLPTGFRESPSDPKYLHPSLLKEGKPIPEQPASYDWRSSGVTSVKDQNGWGTCWIFSGIGDLESKIKIVGPPPDQDYSEWDMWSGNAQGVDNAGGHTRQVANHFTIYGTIREVDAPYQTGYRPGPPYPVASYWSPPAGIGGQKAVREWHYLGDLDTIGWANTLKTYIQNKGPISASVRVDTINNWCSGQGLPAFNTYSWDSALVVPYLPTSSATDHAILIVGWDDTKPHHPSIPGTGAWLVKNSWGTAWGNPGELGYFWIAYGSARIGANCSYYPQTGYKTYDSGETLMYYDEFGCFDACGWNSPPDYDIYAICAYTPSFTGDKYLNNVEFWNWYPGVDWEVRVFGTWDRSGTPSAQIGSTLTGTAPEAGYFTAIFPTSPQLTSGNEIFIQVRYTDPSNTWPYLAPYEYDVPWFPNPPPTDESAKCYVSPTGTGGWADISSGLGDVGIRGRYSGAPAVSDWLLY